eukprot:m.151738 g.151738  ORF g.151738 m.151738 type:complete len:246 (-) comp30776_c0_seq4:167-904(-)
MSRLATMMASACVVNLCFALTLTFVTGLRADILNKAHETSQPNIVFLLIDDLGINDVGYMNQTANGEPSGRLIRTPNIDRLAAAGVKLMANYVQEMCTPTRAALMTGRYPFRYGMTAFTIGADEPWGIPIEENFLPQLLKDAGYATAAFGKWHLGFFKEMYCPWKRGFDVTSGILNAQADHYTHIIDGGYDWHVNGSVNLALSGDYSGNLVRDDAVDFIHGYGRDKSKPFFLYLPFQECHSPFQA